MFFDNIKQYYNEEFYKKDDLKTFVQANMLTPEQYQEICGEPYTTTTTATSQTSATSSQASVANSATA